MLTAGSTRIDSVKHADLGEEEVDRIKQWAWDNYREGREPKPYWHEVARDEWIKINNIRRRKTMYLTFYADDLDDFSFDITEIDCEVEVNGYTVGSYTACLDDVGIESVEVSIESGVSQLTSPQIPEDVRDEIKAAFDVNNTELSDSATGWLAQFNSEDGAGPDDLESRLLRAKARHQRNEEAISYMVEVFAFLGKLNDAP